jgi:hypothetical protein
VLRPVLSPAAAAVRRPEADGHEVATAEPCESPFATSMWARAETDSTPMLAPLTVAGGSGWLPASRLGVPYRPDLDPATYLRSRCCPGDGACAPGGAPLLPVLVVGSPAARRSEAHGRVGRAGMDELVERAVAQAAATGCRAVLAPWCAQRGSGGRLRAAFEARGALVERHSYAHSIDLAGRTAADFAAGLPRPVRLRREREADAARAAGFRCARLSAGEWARQRTTARRLAAELDAGAALAPDGAGPWELLDALEREGPDLHVWGAYRGDELRACAVLLAHGGALWLVLRALAREPRGFPSGLYFSLLLQDVVTAASDDGFTRVEYGTSASGAWVVRGCDATAVHSCLLPIDTGGEDR